MAPRRPRSASSSVLSLQSTPQCFKTKVLTLAIACTLAGVACTAVLMPGIAQAQAETSAEREYAIGPGALSDVLAEFSAMAGVQLVFEPQMLAGLQSPGLQGRHSVQGGFSQLLQGSGYRLVSEGDGAYSLREIPTGARTLPPVRITGTSVADGSVESGYVSEEVSQVGPWQGRALQDTPYSVNVVSEDLLENWQVTNRDTVFRMNPVVQQVYPEFADDQVRIYMRGFMGRNVAINGIDPPDAGANSLSFGPVMEGMAQVEVLTGPSGFLYGGGNVGGQVNYVTKKPTDERLASITTGVTSGRNAYIHGDFGGQFDEDGMFGYRINLVTQGGETHVDDERIDRDSINTVFDWQVTDDLIIDLGFSKRDLLRKGQRPVWRLASLFSEDVERPKADFIDQTEGWGQDWSFSSIESERSEIGAHWDINSTVTFRSRYAKEEAERAQTYAFNRNVDVSNNTYDTLLRAGAPLLYKNEGGYAFLDIAFNTGSISHKLTIGTQLATYSDNRHEDSRSQTQLNGLSLSAPPDLAEPDWEPYGTSPMYEAARGRNETLTVGDDITFNERWSALVGISQATITTNSYNTSGERTGHYSDTAVTPTLSVLYKPRTWLTTYGTYIEALEAGGVADEDYEGLEVVNAGEVLAPQVSTQFEFGAKATMSGVLLTAAVFRIDRASAVYDVFNDTQARYEYEDGKDIREGLEVTATGKLTANLTMVGGLTKLFFDGGGDATPSNVSSEMYKAYLEYVPPFISGLTLNGGVAYTGEFSASDGDVVGSRTLFDVGARYQVELANKPLTLRLSINNVTDERYWAGFQNFGETRTVSFSANIKL